MKWLEQLLIRHTPPCAEVTRLISESNERALGLHERIALRLHYLICVWCKRYAVQVRAIRGGVRQQARLYAADTGISAEARDRIRRRLEQTSSSQDTDAARDARGA